MLGLRARFVRDLVEAFERDGRAELVDEVFNRVQSRLATPDVRGALRAASHADALGLGDAEELLFGLDASVGDGTGQFLEKFSTELFARVLAQGNFTVVGDLSATVARMQAPLEHLFVGLPIGFDVSKKRDGFVLFLGVSGRPRTTRLLRHLAVGAVRAGQRFAREGMNEDVVLSTESMGERARIEARLGTAAPPNVLVAPPPRPKVSRPSSATPRPSRPHLPTTRPTLEAMDRIIRRASVLPPAMPHAADGEIVAPRSRRPAIQAPPVSSPPVSSPPVSSPPVSSPPMSTPPVSAPPRSDTLPSLSQSGFVAKHDDDEESSSG